MSRNVGFAVLYRGFSGDSSCSIGKKSWSAYLSFVSKHMLQNNLLYKYEMIGIVIAVLFMQIPKILLDIFIFCSYNVKKYFL